MISELEEKGRRRSNQQEETPRLQIKSKCPRDANLKRILNSDVRDNCSVKTIPRTNMDLLISWVKDNLSFITSDCVLYCGLYDINDGSYNDAILDNLGSLISELNNNKKY